MDEAQRDATLVKIQITVAKISTDMTWVKRIVGVLIIALLALLGVSLPPGLLN